MRRFIIEQSDADITSHSGLALVGMALNRHCERTEMVDRHIPLRHPALRRRIRTVIQELMHRAARAVESGRRLKLAFSRHCNSVAIFNRLYQQLVWT